MKREKINFDLETLPLDLRRYVEGATMYDSSCSEGARTILVEGEERVYLKRDWPGSLIREYKMTNFLNQYGLAPKAIHYHSDDNYDYLLTEALTGEDGVSGGHLDNPRKLAIVFGESLRRLHSVAIADCPFINRTAEMLVEISAKKPQQTLKEIELLKNLAVNDVVIHGDYCLPNIIMEDYKLKGFIDLGSGGVGDRHYDLIWGIWTLNYNLKSETFRDIFLDAYGRDEVDEDRLRLFGMIEGIAE